MIDIALVNDKYFRYAYPAKEFPLPLNPCCSLVLGGCKYYKKVFGFDSLRNFEIRGNSLRNMRTSLGMGMMKMSASVLLSYRLAPKFYHPLRTTHAGDLILEKRPHYWNFPKPQTKYLAQN